MNEMSAFYKVCLEESESLQLTCSHYSKYSGHHQDVTFSRPVCFVDKVTASSLVFPHVFVTLVRFTFLMNCRTQKKKKGG